MEGRALVRVGILGQGRSGRDIHAEWLSRSPGKYRIVAVSDLLRDRRDRAVREFECDAYADYKELLARQDLDLIGPAICIHKVPWKPLVQVIMSSPKNPWLPAQGNFGEWWRRPGGQAGCSHRFSSQDTRRNFSRYAG